MSCIFQIAFLHCRQTLLLRSVATTCSDDLERSRRNRALRQRLVHICRAQIPVSRTKPTRLVFCLRALKTSVPRSTLRLRPLARRIPRRHCMGRVGCSRAHHMRSLRPTRQPPAHRVWMPPHCPRLRVDPAQPSSAIRLAPHARVVWTGCGRAGKVQAPTAQVVERPDEGDVDVDA